MGNDDRQRRVAAISDMSGFGRCSLTVALPILSAMGVQACPVPAMLLSAHTGYPDPVIRDLTEMLPAYLSHWERLGLRFDAVLTGFLGSARQADLILPFLRRQKAAGAKIVVDPAMADNGALYPTCDLALVEGMRRLAACADAITPNLTEALLLAGGDPAAVSPQDADIAALGGRLLALGCGAAVITGIPDGDRLINAVCLPGERPLLRPVERVRRSYAGTGDVFSAVLCGALMRGEGLTAAVDIAAGFVYRSIARTAADDAPEQDGIRFEPFLRDLCV